MNFGNDRMLISRLVSGYNQKKQFTFLLGSGCTLSNTPTEKGVSSVSEIVSQIKGIFENDNQLDILAETLSTTNQNSNEYQVAINTLLQCYGQDDVNKVIVNAVLNARNTSIVYSNKNGSTYDLEDIERDLSGWNVKNGMAALGKLLVKYPKVFRSPVLTTNFDPLIEVSVANNHAAYNSTCQTNDGQILNQVSNSIVQVIHLHGFWRHGDTLHSPYQLTKERPLLKGDLRKLLNNTILVVLGYGGWGDVFTSTLIEVITEGGNDCNVLWTFYSEDENNIISRNNTILDKLRNSLDQRVVLYKGIDFNLFLPELFTIIDQKNFKEGAQPEPREENSCPVESSAALLDLDQPPTSNKIDTAYDCDTPPSNTYWVGREKELSILAESNYKACFITGIGGQGKSGLASHFITSSALVDYDFWDWRDCKEEDNRFITIIIGVVERLTNGKYRSYQLAKEPIGQIVDLFFKELGNRRVIFVFDNIDNYIDLNNFYPSRGIKELLDKILTLNHNSKFIFTCRPEINSHSPNLIQITLKDLSLHETKELYNKINCSLTVRDKEAIAEDAHNLTSGHPLWLSLIGAQLYKGKEVVLKFIEDIKNSKGTDIQNPSAILAVNTLNIVWKLLNPKQETLMRGLAETVVAETERHLRDVMRSELNDNQFTKAFNAIKKMNLVVIKSPKFAPELYELHPLVKEFIIYKYPKKERNRFITMFVNFYDQVILLVKKIPEPTAPLSLFQNWTNKIELEVNKENYESALATLHQISDSIITAGYMEEYQRVATRLFIEVDFTEATTKEFPYFDEQLTTFCKTLSEVGKFNEAEAFLTKFSKSISIKGAQYITLCNTFAYHYWCKKDYKLSIEYSEKAMELINNSNIIIGQDVSHTLALALRDTCEVENINKAINIFTGGDDVDTVIDKFNAHDLQGATYYGNIGRCLWFLEDKLNALKFYKKSLSILVKEMSSNSQLNRGFAASWIMEALLDLKQYNEAFYFYRLSLRYWEIVAPVKRAEVERSYQRYFRNISEKLLKTSDWEVEKQCLKFIDSSK